MTKEEIQQIYDYSKSKGEICKKLNIRTNKNAVLIDKDILLYFSQIGIESKEQISKKNLSNHWLEIQKIDYELNPKYCEYCGKKLPFEKRFAKCCNQSCGSALGNKKKGKRTEETKRKISKTIIKQIDLGNISLRKPKQHCTQCKYCGKDIIYIGSKNYKRYCSNECKKQYLSEHTGGYRKGSGIGKHGWYKGIYCDSTWELAFLIYHLDHNLFIQRCKEYRKYFFENKEHKYIPDFITDEGIIEIKGYKTKESEAKRLQNPDIKCLYKEDIIKYINYVKGKYKVNNIKDLYE